MSCRPFRIFALWATITLPATLGRCQDEAPPLKLTIYPAAAPRPALKHQLLPDFKERIRGNAAVYYGKVTAEQTGVFGDGALLDKIDNWRDVPLAELRKEDVTMPTDGIESRLYHAARCESCDWQLPVREEEFYTIPLPEVQQTRQFGRILATRARIQIARGDFDGAVKTFQSAYALARNVAEGETLVNGLVGMAISGMMYERLLEFTQQPKAPNLYWALTMLPRPLIDLRKGAEAERSAAELSFPELRDLDAKRSPDEWRQTLHRFWEKVIVVGDLERAQAGDAEHDTADSLTARSLKGYAAAKQALLERGFSTDALDAMPAAQVVMRGITRTYEDQRDSMFKWFFVTCAESIEGSEAAKEEIEQAELENRELSLLAKLLLPGVQAITRAAARTQRDIAILRLIEALRMYGAEHDGHLPKSLDDIDEVPVPLDPVTGKPFAYAVKGDTANVRVSALPGRPTIYEIKMARP
jgi:hypothetical protein